MLRGDLAIIIKNFMQSVRINAVYSLMHARENALD